MKASSIAFPAALILAAAAVSGADDGTDRDAELTSAAGDPAVVRQGKEIYAGLCQTCHGNESVRGDSPSNLFDEKWHHGSRPAEIEAVVIRGVLEKGMPAWGEVLPSEDTTAVTAYLLSVHRANQAR